jgi:branched-chain amino acid transport system permease protein
MSLDLLLGYAGLASLGHAAFFGVAAYAVGLLTLRAGWNPWAVFPVALLTATVTGALYGLLALRARGTYFLMITLALAQVLWGIAFGWRTMTGGDDGLPNVPRPVLALPWSLSDTLPFYYFVLLVVGVAALLLVCIVRSPFGYALRGIRESESRMLALGYNAWRYKYLAFVLAATFAGVSGALYAYYNRFVGIEYLHVVRSAEVLLMVILGGAGTLIGPAVGAALIVVLENVISNYTQRWLMILGGIYVVVTLLAPKGLVGLIQERWGRRQ